MRARSRVTDGAARMSIDASVMSSGGMSRDRVPVTTEVARGVHVSGGAGVSIGSMSTDRVSAGAVPAGRVSTAAMSRASVPTATMPTAVPTTRTGCCLRAAEREQRDQDAVNNSRRQVSSA